MDEESAFEKRERISTETARIDFTYNMPSPAAAAAPSPVKLGKKERVS